MAGDLATTTTGLDGHVDVHFHALPPFMQQRGPRPTDAAAARVAAMGWTPERAVATMDRHGAASAVSLLPPVPRDDPTKASVIARRSNEYAAEMISNWPDRLGAYASIPLADIDKACEETEHALSDLGLDGIGLWVSPDDGFIGEPDFDPLLEVLDQHAAVVFLHPYLLPSNGPRPDGLPGFVVEFPYATTRAAVKLIFSGALQRFPRVRFILAHAGGTLPYLAWRLSAATFIDPGCTTLTLDEIQSGLRHLWYEMALSTSPQTLATLDRVADPSHILFGSDWPFAPDELTRQAVSVLEDTELLDDPGRAAISRLNAAQLFPRFHQPAP